MNLKEIDSAIFNYLLRIYTDFSILIYKKCLEEPFFQASYTQKDKRYWKHAYTPGNKMCVRVNIEKLNREEILINTLHILIHMENRKNGIADMSESAGGRYHKVAFAREANRIGVRCMHDKNYGYQIFQVSDELRHECLNITERYYKDIETYLRIYMAMKDTKRNLRPNISQSFVSYQCPACHKVIKATENSHIICGEDHVPFVRI